jgi:hypothetical protein
MDLNALGISRAPDLDIALKPTRRTINSAVRGTKSSIDVRPALDRPLAE